MKKLFLILMFLCCWQLRSQVGINTTSPNAQLQVLSSNQATPSNQDGILIPRINAFPVTPPTAAQNSMLVYLTTTVGSNTPGFYYWDSITNSWLVLRNANTSAWSTFGNTGILATNFIGSTNNANVNFRRFNVEAGSLRLNATSFGVNSLKIASGAAGLTAFGVNALAVNSSGYNNTAFGEDALRSNTTGYNNTATGYKALSLNVVGDDNTAVGSQALMNNTSNANSAVGKDCLMANTTGSQNSGLGFSALKSNTTGLYNSAMGARALESNVNGSYNTAVGYKALFLNTASNNTALGMEALSTNSVGTGNTAAGYGALLNSTGNNNTAIGFSAMSALTTGDNNLALGNNAQVPSATGSNQVRIGDENISYAGVQVAWTITSDSRWKSNIQNSDLGLDFIKSLRPVSYLRKNDQLNKTEYGFIAQELEQSLLKFGVKNSGIISKDDAGMYSVRYNDLLSPIVKAIQEQQDILDQDAKKIEELNQKMKELAEQVTKIQNK